MKQITLPRLEIEVTTRCNLRCKDCAVGIPSQKETVHLSLEEVQLYLKKIFEVIDYVDSLEFTGGEPFLHEQLPAMIRAYMGYKQSFGRFLIVTNGTIKPSGELLSALGAYKEHGVIHISDYGVNPERTKELIAKLREIGFPCRVDKYWGDDQYQGGWVDPGAVASHGRTAEELESTYSHCGLVKNGGCWRVHKGQLHVCARSCRCLDSGLDFPDDYVDLLDESRTAAEKRAKLWTLRQTAYLHACDYCNGTMGTKDPTKRIPAGIQVN